MILCLSFNIDLLNHIYTFRKVNILTGSDINFLSNIFTGKYET